jgi:hypothetical protein
MLSCPHRQTRVPRQTSSNAKNQGRDREPERGRQREYNVHACRTRKCCNSGDIGERADLTADVFVGGKGAGGSGVGHKRHERRLRPHVIVPLMMTVQSLSDQTGDFIVARQLVWSSYMS